MKPSFDILVVGSGHAAIEAALAGARLGFQTLLATLDKTKIGQMSCNPAVGGVGKGQVVREIDALDGLMGRVADLGGIQFKVLNRRKGPAVRGPRAQADRKLYAAAMQAAIRETANLTVVEGEVDDLLVQDGRVKGVRLADGRILGAGAVVLTTGTFLRGLIHIGERQIPAGRVGETPAMGLSGALERVADRSSLRFSFVFRAVAGLMFGVLFLRRGFGVTVGAHALYDLLVGVVMQPAE